MIEFCAAWSSLVSGVCEGSVTEKLIYVNYLLLGLIAFLEKAAGQEHDWFQFLEVKVRRYLSLHERLCGQKAQKHENIFSTCRIFCAI